MYLGYERRGTSLETFHICFFLMLKVKLQNRDQIKGAGFDQRDGFFRRHGNVVRDTLTVLFPSWSRSSHFGFISMSEYEFFYVAYEIGSVI